MTTIFVAPHYYDHPWIWSIEAGNILGHRLGQRMGTTLARGFSVERMSPPGFFPAPPIVTEMPGGEMRATIPLWLFIGIIGTPTYFWWRGSRKKPSKPGHCPRCGYDLTGNTSGVCSECGERTSNSIEIPPRTKPQRDS